MANEHTAFWLALLDQGFNREQRARLWNGYLNWKLPPRKKMKRSISRLRRTATFHSAEEV